MALELSAPQVTDASARALLCPQPFNYSEAVLVCENMNTDE
jgi:hypothetical protein